MDPEIVEEIGAEKADGETAEQSEATEQQNDLPSGVKKRFSVLTAKRKEAEAFGRAKEAENQLLKSKLDELEKSVRTLTDERKASVTREHFESEDDYLGWIAEQKAEKLIKERVTEPQEAKRKAEEHRQKVLSDWNGKIASQFDDTAEYRSVVEQLEVEPSPEVFNALLQSEIGPKITYYLAKNPTLAEKVFSSTGRALEREILKLELKLEDAEFKKEGVSKAPKPVAKPIEKPVVVSSSVNDDIAARKKRRYGR